MNPLSTSFDVVRVLHCTPMTLKETRIARLKELAKLKGELGTVALGELIGKKTNQTSDLLTGKAPFGEKVARSIEAHAGLPNEWLDVEAGGGAYWPFSAELQIAVARLNQDILVRVENVIRMTLDMQPLQKAVHEHVRTNVPADESQGTGATDRELPAERQPAAGYAMAGGKDARPPLTSVKLPPKWAGKSVFDEPTQPEDGTHGRRRSNRKAPGK